MLHSICSQKSDFRLRKSETQAILTNSELKIQNGMGLPEQQEEPVVLYYYRFCLFLSHLISSTCSTVQVLSVVKYHVMCNFFRWYCYLMANATLDSEPK